MRKKIITISLIVSFMGLFLGKTTAQTRLDLNKLSLENRLFKGGDTIMQKKNLLFMPQRDITQKRNLLYVPSVDGKPTFKLLNNNMAFDLGLTEKASDKIQTPSKKYKTNKVSK